MSHSSDRGTETGSAQTALIPSEMLIVYPASDRKVDGIRDYSVQLTAQLRADGKRVRFIRPPKGLGLVRYLLNAVPRRECPAILLQYNPFSWGRWGVAPSLVLSLASLRLLRTRARILLTVHEDYVPMRSVRWTVMGLWQRAQMRVLLAFAHGAVASTDAITSELSRGWPKRPIRHVPVGSNLPDERDSRQMTRRAAGFEDHLVVATFSSGHDTHLHHLVSRAAEAVARASSQNVVLHLLGSRNRLGDAVPSVNRIVTPGYLEDRSLAQALAASDLFLAPFGDGAQTRRGTLMAALQQGLPVVTTINRRSDPILLEADALSFASPDDADGFAANAVAIAVDAELRGRRAAASRALYERYFAWSCVASAMDDAIRAMFLR